jgi:hypothetical protein
LPGFFNRKSLALGMGPLKPGAGRSCKYIHNDLLVAEYPFP